MDPAPEWRREDEWGQQRCGEEDVREREQQTHLTEEQGKDEQVINTAERQRALETSPTWACLQTIACKPPSNPKFSERWPILLSKRPFSLNNVVFFHFNQWIQFHSFVFRRDNHKTDSYDKCSTDTGSIMIWRLVTKAGFDGQWIYLRVWGGILSFTCRIQTCVKQKGF